MQRAGEGYRLALLAPYMQAPGAVTPSSLDLLYSQRRQPSDGNNLYLWERCRLEISLRILVM